MTKLKEYTVVLVMNEADIVRSLPKEYYLVLLKCLLLRNFLYSAHAPKLHCGSKKTRQLWRTITTTQFSLF